MKHNRLLSNSIALALGTALLGACSPKPPAATAADAQAFVKNLNSDLTTLALEGNAAGWVQATYIINDTELLRARSSERMLEYFSKAIKESRRFDGLKLDDDTARTIKLLQLTDQISAPAPDDAAKRSELATIMARMEGDYGAGKYCVTKNGKEECRNIDQLSATIAHSRNYDELTEAWAGWHGVGRQMRKDYTRFTELANEGAREIGFADLGAMWRSPYDMKPEEFEAEVDRLWGQVKPLYDQMHCYPRTKLAKKYGEDKVPAGKPIPAQLFGNLWAQQWNNIYGDILKPYPGVKAESVDAALKGQGYDAVKMVKQAQPSREAVLNDQMKIAADKIAFLPFGKLIDQWRWGVFSGKIKPEDYNKAWWKLRESVQGVSAPVPRTEEDFDPGAKYHVPGNTPYTRYFLSFVIQFQFHRALCQAAGYKGPLHECSVFGSKEAGEKFLAMLSAGSSRPWAETLEKLTGTRQMDASAIIEYFEPLMGYLKEQNAGQKCGWDGEA